MYRDESWWRVSRFGGAPYKQAVSAPESIHEPRVLLLNLLAALPDEAAAGAVLVAFCQSADRDAWQAFVEVAANHSVLGILGPVLQRVDIPASVAEYLQRRTVIESMWHAQVRHALADAVMVLGRVSIPVCALKGPVLATRLYDTPSVRPSIDIDLLIRPDDLFRAITCLTDADYRVDDDEVTCEYLLRYGHHLSFSRQGQPGLEVHFHAYAGFGTVIPSGALMDRARVYEFDGTTVLVPRAEDELIYLAVHAAGHSFIRLLWLYDLKQLIARVPAIDWQAIITRARALQVIGPTTAALELLHTWLGVDIPESVLRAGAGFRPRVAKLLLEYVSAPSRPSIADNLGGLIYTALLCDRMTTGMQLVSHHVRRALKRRAYHVAPRALPRSWAG
jgi:hypothetical protein